MNVRELEKLISRAVRSSGIMKAMDKIMTTLKDEAREQVRDELLGKLGGAGKPIANRKPRKKGPVQLCPAPGCTGRAAPIFGMVCTRHKSVPKAIVAKWREVRRKAAAAKPASKPVAAKPAVKKK